MKSLASRCAWLAGLFALGFFSVTCTKPPAPPSGSHDPCQDAPRGPVESLFVDVTADSGVAVSDVVADVPDSVEEGNGVAVGDVNGDGKLDLAITTHNAGVKLYRNQGGLRFEDVTTASGLDGASPGTGAALNDLDGDGDLDLVIVGDRVARLHENMGGGMFRDVTTESGFPADPGTAVGVFVFDANSDGRLDVFILCYSVSDSRRTVNRLMLNRGALRFSEVSSHAGLVEYGLTLAAALVDSDGDDAPELYVGNDAIIRDDGIRPVDKASYRGDAIFRRGANTADGVPAFTEITQATGLEPYHSTMGATFSDVNGDGRLDMYLSNFGRNKLYLARAQGGFEEAAERYGIAATRRISPDCPQDTTKSGCLLVSWSSAFLDADLDGLDDLLVLNGHISFGEAQPTLMFRGVGAGKFTEVSPSIACMEGRGLVPADLDDDGDLDLVITTRTGPVSVYRTEALAGRHWLRVRLRGSQSNSQGIGALLRLTTQSGRQLVRPVGAGGLVHATAPVEAHFGLGTDTVKALDIVWPSGARQHVEPVEVDRVLELTEPL